MGYVSPRQNGKAGLVDKVLLALLGLYAGLVTAAIIAQKVVPGAKVDIVAALLQPFKWLLALVGIKPKAATQPATGK